MKSACKGEKKEHLEQREGLRTGREPKKQLKGKANQNPVSRGGKVNNNLKRKEKGFREGKKGKEMK